MTGRHAIGALVVWASCAQGQLVVGNDQSDPELWIIDVSGAAPARRVAAGASWQAASGAAADDVGRVLYWCSAGTLYKAVYSSTPMVPVIVGPTTGISPTGLAFDRFERRLYARASGGFYELNVNTGAPTLVYALAAQDFGAFDYDPGTDAFYGANDSTATTVVPGRGLYRISKPLSNPTFTLLAAYPNRLDNGQPDLDIDGLAAGGGRLYLVNDTPAQGAYVWNLATGAFEAPIATMPYSGTNGLFCGAAWAPNLLNPPVGADVAVAIAANPSELVLDPLTGGTLSYIVTLRNYGPDDAAGVELTAALPPGLQFVSADNGAMFSAGAVRAQPGVLASGQVRTYTIVTRATLPGVYECTGSATTTTNDHTPANNQASASAQARTLRADLRVSIQDPADCSAVIGSMLTYTVGVVNDGPEAALGTGVLVTLPEGTVLAGVSDAPVWASGGEMEFRLGDLASGAAWSVQINLRALRTGEYAMVAAARSGTPDPDAVNSTVTERMLILGGGLPAATSKGVATTIEASSTSVAFTHGTETARYASGITPGRPFRSPDGTKWIMAWDTTLGTLTDQVLMVGSVREGGGSDLRVAVQEGVTELPTLRGSSPTTGPFRPSGNFDAVQSINNAGQFVFSGVDSRSGVTDDGYVVRGNADTPATFTLIAQENVTVAPSGTGGTFFGSARSSAHLALDGTAGFVHTILPANSDTDEFLFKAGGGTVLARAGTTIPGSQHGGTSYLLDDLDSGSAQLGVCFNADHTSWIASAWLDSPVTTDDRVVLLNGDVVVQEGYPLTGRSSPVAAVHAVRMEPEGNWFVRGSDADGSDWIVRNGAVLAGRGDGAAADLVAPWSDTVLANTFFMMLEGPGGDVVVGGAIGGAEWRTDSVLVLNGERVLLRENDAVDLDADGVFDDGHYIRTFVDDRAFLTNDELYVVVRLRDADAALCAGADTDRGQALVRVPLVPPGPACDPDINCDGVADQSDIACIILVVAGDLTCSCQADPDFNRDGVPDQADVSDLILVVAGAPCP